MSRNYGGSVPWLSDLMAPHLWVAASPKLSSRIDNFNLRSSSASQPVSPSAAAVKYFVIFICKSCLTTLYEFVCSMGIFIVPLIEYANAFSHVGPVGSPATPAPVQLWSADKGTQTT